MNLNQVELDLHWVKFKRDQNLRSRDILIEHYERLCKITVAKLAQYLPAKIDREDLQLNAVVGLIKAVDQFDPKRGIKFDTYGISLIRGAILEHMRDDDWVPRSVRDAIKLLNETERLLTIKLKRSPTEIEICEAMKISEEKYREICVMVGRTEVYSYDQSVYEDRDGVKDNYPSHDIGVDEIVEQKHTSEYIREAMSKLPPREADVMARYYWQGQTFKQIGTDLGCSESRAYQLAQQARSRLKFHLRSYAPEAPYLEIRDISQSKSIPQEVIKTRKRYQRRKPSVPTKPILKTALEAVESEPTMSDETLPQTVPIVTSRDQVFDYLIGKYLDEVLPNDPVGQYIRHLIKQSGASDIISNLYEEKDPQASTSDSMKVVYTDKVKSISAARSSIPLSPEEIQQRMESGQPYAGLRPGDRGFSQIQNAKKKQKDQQLRDDLDRNKSAINAPTESNDDGL